MTLVAASPVCHCGSPEAPIDLALPDGQVTLCVPCFYVWNRDHCVACFQSLPKDHFYIYYFHDAFGPGEHFPALMCHGCYTAAPGDVVATEWQSISPDDLGDIKEFIRWRNLAERVLSEMSSTQRKQARRFLVNQGLLDTPWPAGTAGKVCASHLNRCSLVMVLAVQRGDNAYTALVDAFPTIVREVQREFGLGE